MTVNGWDAETRQSVPDLVALGKAGYQVAGFYLGGPRASTSHLGHGYATLLHIHGFALVPIYVGRQGADLTGLSPAKVTARAKVDAAEAVALYAKLVKEAPKAVLCRMALDWEGPMSQEGAVYCREWLDTVVHAQYLYRTDAGIPTPDRHVWLAKPGISEAQAAALMVAQPYGHVEGVQYEWRTVDTTLWADSVIPPKVPDKPPRHTLTWYLAQAVKAWRANRG